MFKLVAACLAGLFVIFLAFGDESRREVQAARQSDAIGFSFSDLMAPEEIQETALPELAISDSEAIAMAIDAGKAHRLNRTTEDLRGSGADLVALSEPSKPIQTWVVTGNRVNLRAGPGTSNPVVAQLTLGSETIRLDSKDGWHQISSLDGGVTGWISAQFLAQN